MSTIPTTPSMAEHCRPRAFPVAYEVLLVVLGTLAITASAYVVIPLPVSPVPVTAQTLVVLLIGALYGATRAAATVLTYLIQGAAGLPVFAGGLGGAVVFVGPTAGYLLGFLLAAIGVGAMAERGWDRRPIRVIVSMIAGYALIYLPGVLWLSWFVGAENVLAAGLYPFLPGAVLKIGIAAALLPLGWRGLRALETRLRRR
jgi:biotin transport system substrate-specific component